MEEEMIKHSKQQWVVGQFVKVGFVSNLMVVAAIPTPGDNAPDAYLLSRNEQFYSCVPHNGLTKITSEEARAMVAEAKAQAARAEKKAAEQAAKTLAHIALVSELAFG